MLQYWIYPILYQIGQIIKVNSTTPCFFNYTAGQDMWQNCGMDKDYLQASLLMWDWISGGLFSMIVVSVLILATYIKYQKIVYPAIIGIMFLPISFYFFPAVFVIWGAILLCIGIGLLIAYIIVSQTNEQ